MKVTYRQPSGATTTVEVPDGSTVMRAAVDHAVPGIVGECGGQAMCATCHVYVATVEPGPLPPVSDDEDEMLDCVAAPRDPDRSRLGCQLAAGAALAAITVDVPGTQV